MGALSPRTRNKQVEMYQNGDVDFLIATDAIGMGLNMDIHHVALASDMKFDGRYMRRLVPQEIAKLQDALAVIQEMAPLASQMG